MAVPKTSPNPDIPSTPYLPRKVLEQFCHLLELSSFWRSLTKSFCPSPDRLWTDVLRVLDGDLLRSYRAFKQ